MEEYLKLGHIELISEPDDCNSIDPLETAGIYRINYHRGGGGTGAYISKTKRKIKERIAEHKRDIKLNKETTALAKLNRIEDIEIDFTHIKKLSNYENHNYALKRESIEIIAEKQCCNLREHALIHQSWKPFVMHRRTDIK